jgi:eukaryotic-like serine/threonine-protein kinase
MSGTVGARKYSIVRPLASGGMGELFLAEQAGPAGFSKSVVIKKILKHLANDTRFIQQFQAEAKFSALLSHPNVVQIFELGEENGSYFIVMEYVPGVSLRRALDVARASSRPMTPTLVARIGIDVLRGLHHAHTLRVNGKPFPLIHRDVSPENILLGESGTVKLVDFGMAKALGAASGTAPGTLFGKVSYVTPEQIRDGAVEPRSDLYSVGVVLYEMLSGQPPFQSDTQAHLLQQILTRKPTRLNELLADVPAELSAIVERALAKDPVERFASAEQMATALETFLQRTGYPSAQALMDFVRETAEANPEDSKGWDTSSTRGLREPSSNSEPSIRPVRTGAPLRTWAAAVLVGVLLAVGGWWALTRRPSSTNVAAPPAPVARSSEPVPVPPPPEPTPPHRELSPEPVRAPTRRVTPKPQRTARAAAAPVSFGRVIVYSKPWAEVFFSGEPLGITPITDGVRLPEGDQELLLKNPQLGLTKTVRVRVSAGETTVVKVDLADARR